MSRMEPVGFLDKACFEDGEVVAYKIQLSDSDMPLYTEQQIREMVEEVRADALEAFRILHRGADSVETAAVNAALDAILARLDLTS